MLREGQFGWSFHMCFSLMENPGQESGTTKANLYFCPLFPLWLGRAATRSAEFQLGTPLPHPRMPGLKDH